MLYTSLLVAGLLAGQPASDAGALEGTWQLTLTLPIEQRAPLLGDTSRDFVMHAIVEVTGEDGALTQRTRPCAVELEGGGAARVEVPSGFPAAIRVPPSAIRADKDALTTALSGVAVGYRAEDGDQPPPTDDDDPRVVDNDRDGDPGASVVLHVLEVGEVRLFVVLRLALHLEGERTGDDRYEGAVHVREFTQNIIGSSPPLPVVDQVETSARDGRFTLERTDAGECQAG